MAPYFWKPERIKNAFSWAEGHGLVSTDRYGETLYGIYVERTGINGWYSLIL